MFFRLFSAQPIKHNKAMTIHANSPNFIAFQQTWENSTIAALISFQPTAAAHCGSPLHSSQIRSSCQVLPGPARSCLNQVERNCLPQVERHILHILAVARDAKSKGVNSVNPTEFNIKSEI